MATLLPAAGLALVLEARWEISRASRLLGYSTVGSLRLNGFLYGPVLLAIGVSEWVAIWNLQNPGRSLAWHTPLIQWTLFSAFVILVVTPALVLIRLGFAGLGWWTLLALRELPETTKTAVFEVQVRWQSMLARRDMASLERESQLMTTRARAFELRRQILVKLPMTVRSPEADEFIEEVGSLLEEVSYTEQRSISARQRITELDRIIRRARENRRAARRNRNRAVAERQARRLARLLPPPTAEPKPAPDRDGRASRSAAPLRGRSSRASRVRAMPATARARGSGQRTST